MLPLLNIVTRTHKPTTYYEEEKQNGIRRFKRKRDDYAGRSERGGSSEADGDHEHDVKTSKMEVFGGR